LQSNIFGGTQAILVVPEVLLGDDTPKVPEPRELPAAVPQAMPVRQPAPPPQLPSVQLRPLPTAGTGHYGNSVPQRMGATPANGFNPSHGATRVDTGALPVTAELQAVDPDRPNGYDQGAHARPELPKRSKQTHLAPQLRDEPQHGARGSETGHDPGLMKAFQQGQQRADTGPQIPASDGSVSPYRNEEF
jgi:hypothetical protein